MSAIQLGHTTEVRDVDRPLVGRLLEAFRRSNEARSYGRGSMWESIRQKHDELVVAIQRDDVDAVGAALQRPDRSELFYGFEDLGTWSVAAYQNDEHRHWYAHHCYDVLQRLGESVGVLAVANPELPERRPSVPPPSELVGQVEGALGFPTAPPAPYPNYYGLETTTGILGERVLHALYGAHRIRQLTAGIGQPRVLEIGAGLGRLAHYASLAGITDYWIVDLPLTSLAHGHFLATALGADRVVLDGEPDPPAGSGHVRILSAEQFFERSLPTFDLVVNVDSITELGRPLAEKYLEVVAPLTPGLFSINHEVNEFTVADLLRTSPAFGQSQRHPCWVRAGYVEELAWHTGPGTR